MINRRLIGFIIDDRWCSLETANWRFFAALSIFLCRFIKSVFSSHWHVLLILFKLMAQVPDHFYLPRFAKFPSFQKKGSFKCWESYFWIINLNSAIEFCHDLNKDVWKFLKNAPSSALTFVFTETANERLWNLYSLSISLRLYCVFPSCIVSSPPQRIIKKIWLLIILHYTFSSFYLPFISSSFYLLLLLSSFLLSPPPSIFFLLSPLPSNSPCCRRCSGSDPSNLLGRSFRFRTPQSWRTGGCGFAELRPFSGLRQRKNRKK